MLIDGIRTFAHAMIDGFTEADSAGGADEQAGGETDPEKPGDGEQFWSAMSLPTPRLELVQRTEKIAEKKEKNTKGRVKYVETPRQAHEEMIMNKILRIRGKGEGAKEIEEWLGARL